MDANGTRFHLIKGETDWLACSEEEPDGTLTSPAGVWRQAEYDAGSQSLALRALLPVFQDTSFHASLPINRRRGAGMDRDGNWYWISQDQRQIIWLSVGADRPRVFWQQTTAACVPGEGTASAAGAFAPIAVEEPALELAGLAVTRHHYLVVGDAAGHRLLLFDLYAATPPLALVFPPQVPFAPFDMAPMHDGGVLLLDQQHRTYWRLDRTFRVVTERSSATGSPSIPLQSGTGFQPVNGTGLSGPPVNPDEHVPAGFPVAAVFPVSIEAMPDGSALIMDRPDLGVGSPPTASVSPNPSMDSSGAGGNGSASATASVLYRYRLAQQLGRYPLRDDVEEIDENDNLILRQLSVLGYDMAYTPPNASQTSGPGSDGTLTVEEHNGKQAIVFLLQFASARPLYAQRTYLPLHAAGHRALVPAFDPSSSDVYYDVVGRDPTNDFVLRWVTVQPIADPRYERDSVLLTPIFDGKTRACVWHRLFLDACLPSNTSVAVSTRAHDDPELLAAVPFQPEPALYLRGMGAELPFYDPFPEMDALPAGTGTWELLFQQAQGRYLQIRLELSGSGRDTPQIRALRAYYPRFSYPKRYLPAVYQDDADSANFLERLLANMEGIYTALEDKMNAVRLLFDARSAPPETLDWLASWLGLALDPLWADIQQRRDQAQGPPTPGQRPSDRRRLFIRYARKLYERRGTPDGIRFALHLLLDSCLETTLERLKTDIALNDPALRADLTKLGLPLPTPQTSEQALEDLLFDYVLAPNRPSPIRLVEGFLTRGGRAILAGDPSQLALEPHSGGSGLAPLFLSALNGAHQFSVLIPQGLSADEEAMVTRIVELEKPAHTYFDVRSYINAFILGAARLQIDTVLGESSRFTAVIIGQTALASGYLYPAPPQDTEERVILQRDRLGQRAL